MSENSPSKFVERKVEIVDLPLPDGARLLHPERVMVRVAGHVHDIGAYCYASRSPKKRKANRSAEVTLQSFQNHRVPQVLGLIRTLSKFLTVGGLRPYTVHAHCEFLKNLMDWADRNGHVQCLAGGANTYDAYRLYAADVEDGYRRQLFGSTNAFQKQTYNLKLLEALTGLTDLAKGIRLVRKNGRESLGTEPANLHDFAHALAINEALFKGLTDLVLEQKPFPYRLQMPASLDWEQNYLWVFPNSQWFQSPKRQGAPEAHRKVYDYRNGRLATEDAIWPCFQGKTEHAKRFWARRQIELTQRTLNAANINSRSYFRLRLASVAFDSFGFLFLAHTGVNLQTFLDIESDGAISDGTANQGYRVIKWRAGGKEVDVVVPVGFMPTLRRFMELRRYTLNGVACPYLFLARGITYTQTPGKGDPQFLQSSYLMMRRIDPELPQITSRKIRATVSAWFISHHDASVTAKVLQNATATTLRNYNAGTVADQVVEMTMVLEKIAQKAQTMVVSAANVAEGAKTLNEGGVCSSFGQPRPLFEDPPLAPTCKTGCLFCSKRVLVAGEGDARKVASAAFLMRRLIHGSQSHAEYLPLIMKCEEDLGKLAAFEGCAETVDRVKKDVYENGNLTPYFADKYQLFLELGVL
ncbi:hypothetical protein C8C96_2428 [Acidovorax sp. 100]|uniref:hypothetical protein n=1 Tax=Acidovorax sp. 100 TaxID=2135635 RepID=UPI000EFA11E0|nr:hypothetical protein [Acidovorax sp. 100]RMA61398.1 hypothetical protein C8C96_2428 [Acidovorax sp. 100]